MRIAANACTDELRRRARRPALSLDAPPPGSDEPLDVADAAPGPKALALRGEQQAQSSRPRCCACRTTSAWR